jgi:hypothetical protein
MTPSVKTFSLLALAAMLAGTVFLLGRGDAENDQPQPSPIDSGLATAEEGPVSTGGFTDGRLISSLSQLVNESDVVASVSYVERLADYWPGGDTLNTVFSRYRLRVDDVIAGDAAAGGELVVYVQGGVKAKWGDPTSQGGFKPRPGEETVDAELPYWPRFKEGRQELVFLAARPIRGTGEVVLFAPGDGRYRVVNGKVVSLYVDVPKDPNQLAPGDYRREIIGTTVDELRAKISAVKSE